MQQGHVAVGHPVDVASGVLFNAWHDVEIWGHYPLVFRRYYSTALLDDASAGLGPGYIHNFAHRLQRIPTGYRFHGHDGIEAEFNLPQNSGTGDLAVLNESQFMELRRIDGRFVVYHWHDWRDSVERFWFETDGGDDARLIRCDTPDGIGLSLNYDSRGRLDAIRMDLERRLLRLQHNADGLVESLAIESEIASPRVVARFAYHPTRRLARVFDALGQAISYDYDGAGRLCRETQRGGGIFTFEYDDLGRCIRSAGTGRFHERLLKYGLWGNTTAVLDTLGNQTLYTCNLAGQVVSERRPNGAVFATEFDGHGRPANRSGPAGELSRFEYDQAGNLTTEISPNGSTISATLNAEHQPIEIRQGSARWELRYAHGAIVTITDPMGARTDCERDAMNVAWRITRPGGITETMQYDPAWSRISFHDEEGPVEEYHYDTFLWLTAIVDAHGRRVEHVSDPLGRVVLVRFPDGAAVRMSYDAGGFVRSLTDARDQTTTFEHDVFGQCLRQTDANGQSVEFKWNTEGWLVCVIDKQGSHCSITHDVMGNEHIIEHFDGSIETAEYDLSDRRTRLRRGESPTLSFDFDLAGNCVRISGGTDVLAAYAYDDRGLMLEAESPDARLKFAYDRCGRLIEERQNDTVIRYVYDQSGVLSERLFERSPDGPVRFEFDTRRRLRSVSRGSKTAETYEYDAIDNLTTRFMGRCTERRDYDQAGETVRQIVRRGPEILVERYAGFDAARLLVAKSDNRRGSTEYSYDPGARLAAVSGDQYNVRVMHDANDNLLHVEGDGPVRDFSYGPGNLLREWNSAACRLDGAGNLAAVEADERSIVLVWDALHQLRSVTPAEGPATHFGYDALGRRTFKEQAGSRTDFFWAGMQIVGAQCGEQVTEYLLASYVPMIVWTGSRAYHVVTNELGLPLEYLDANGRVVWTGNFDPWGNLLDETGDPVANPFRFPGQYADPEIPFVYNTFRYYDPIAGRYISPDPLGLGAGFNLYRYCANPLNFIDPLGLTCGISAGTHSVYVLEKGPPPSPPQIVYVGITMQCPHERLKQHKSDPPGSSKFPGGVDFDQMRVIASGPTAVNTRRDARNIEGSILHHASAPGQIPGVSAASLGNADRPVNGGLYHSYNPTPGNANTSTGGHPIASAPACAAMVAPNAANPVIR